MAEASFTIRAVDATRAAFLNVQNSLAQLKNSSATASAFLQKAFSPKALGTGLASALGISLVGAIDSAVEALGRFLTRFNDVQKIVKASAEEVAKIYEDAFLESVGPEQQLSVLARRRRELEKEIFQLRQKTAVITRETMTMDRTGQVRTVRTFTSEATREEADKLKGLEETLARINVRADSISTKKSIDQVKQLEDSFDALIAAQKKSNDEAEASRLEFEKLQLSLKEAASGQLDLLDPMREYEREIKLVNKLELEGLLNVQQAEQRRIQIRKDAAEFLDRDLKKLREIAEAHKDILDPTREYTRELQLIDELQSKGLLTVSEAARRRQQITSASQRAGTAGQDEYNASLREFEQIQNKVYGREVSISDQVVALKSREAQLMGELSQIASDDLASRTMKQSELVEVYRELEPLMEEQRRLGKEAGDMIAMGFEDAILSGNKLSDVLKNLAQDLMRLIFRNVITAPLAAGIGNFINGGLGFLAEGGPARAGSPYIVGEKGPELFVPGSSGTVIPNDRMNQMGGSAGGTTVNISYNIQSGVSRAELQPILETERKRLRAEIPDMVRRGGSYRSAFA
jgi:hypothetical protein